MYYWWHIILPNPKDLSQWRPNPNPIQILIIKSKPKFKYTYQIQTHIQILTIKPKPKSKFRDAKSQIFRFVAPLDWTMDFLDEYEGIWNYVYV